MTEATSHQLNAPKITLIMKTPLRYRVVWLLRAIKKEWLEVREYFKRAPSIPRKWENMTIEQKLYRASILKDRW